MTTVSVIIPLFNRKTFIGETLSSLQANLHPEVLLDVIVVDDESTDGGSDWVKTNYPNVRVFEQKNAGAPVARNLGLKNAMGDYILFLDSDDLIEPDFFRVKIQSLENNPSISAIYGPWEHFTLNGKNEKIIIPRHTAYPIETEVNYEDHLTRLLGGWYIVPHALLWRKSVLIQLNGFDESLKINQDVDLLFRLLVSKAFIAGITSPLALYRDHDGPDRTGAINNNNAKLLTVFELRKKFIPQLIQAELFTETNKVELSRFCFHYWARHREQAPDIAEMFYKLSVELNPKHQLEGGLVLRTLSKLLGPKQTFILKSLLRKA